MIDELDYNDEFPYSLTADLAQFYPGTRLDDVWAGRVSAGYVLSLIGQLQLIPNSRVRMIRAGGDIRHLGWDIHAEILSEQYDQVTAVVSGFSGNDKPIFYPRPGESVDRRGPEGSEKLFAPTIADFNTSAFMSELTR